MPRSPRQFLAVLILVALIPNPALGQAKPLGTIVQELRSIHLDDKDFPFADVPALVQQLLPQMKQGLRQEIFNALEDNQNASATPEALREIILQNLKAKSVEIWSEDPSQKDDHTSELYGRLLGLDAVRPDGHPDLIAFRTNISIPCGDDSSLYIFERKESRWHLAISREQDSYTSISDARGRFEFKISPSDENGDWFVVAVDVNPWCTSNWQAIRYEVFRPSFTPDRPRVLLSEEKETYLGVDDIYDLSVRKDGFEINHVGSQSLDAALLTRDHVENYSVRGNRVSRIPPFALRPEDFLDEWFEMSWEEAKRWAPPSAAGKLRTWHAKFSRSDSERFATELDFVQPCPGSPRKWQIGLPLEALGHTGLSDATPKELFFTIIKNEDKYFVQGVATTRPEGCPGRERPAGLQ